MAVTGGYILLQYGCCPRAVFAGVLMLCCLNAAELGWCCVVPVVTLHASAATLHDKQLLRKHSCNTL